MTDRVHSIQVILEKDVRIDDVQAYIDALRLFRGVANVVVMGSGATEMMAVERARHELGSKILDVIYPPKEKT